MDVVHRRGTLSSSRLDSRRRTSDMDHHPQHSPLLHFFNLDSTNHQVLDSQTLITGPLSSVRKRNPFQGGVIHWHSVQLGGRHASAPAMPTTLKRDYAPIQTDHILCQVVQRQFIAILNEA